MSIILSPSESKKPESTRSEFPEKDMAETMCLFACLPSGFPKDNVLGVLQTQPNGIFCDCQHSIATILPYESQKFLCASLKDPSKHYVLLLSADQRPILVVTALSAFGGLCLALELKADPENVLAFSSTIPTIPYTKDPLFDRYTPASEIDLAAFDRISRTFRRVFSFFESIYSTPMPCGDSLSVFRLLRMKVQKISEAFGINSTFLVQSIFEEPMRRDISIDTNLFSATVLLLLFAANKYGIENQLRVVLMSIDRCPAACLHFRVDSDLLESSILLQFVKALYRKHNSYFKFCIGEEARKYAEKIPGVGHMIRNDRYAAFGDHTLSLFAPVKRDWTNFTLRAPLFLFSEDFFRGFERFDT